ncbi:MAG: queuosine precursor transporter [Clostridiaceae bacterium]|nr:queuosine precursor transporter [Clostridiaceae bacterium]
MKHLKAIFSAKEKVSNLQVTLTLTLTLCLILSNIIVIKSINLFGVTALANSAAILVFPITYMLSDLFSEVYGYAWSRKTAMWSLLGTALASVIFQLTIMLKGNDAFLHQEALEAILGNTPKILLASLLAFYIGDWANDKVFQIMKKKSKDGKGFFYRSIGSSLVGKYVDAVIFTFIGLSFLPMTTKLIMVANAPLVQIAIETIVFPATNFFSKLVKKAELRGVINEEAKSMPLNEKVN